MIQLNDVTVCWRDYVVFQHLNVSFNQGNSYLVEGKNGAGKTTLLNLLAGKIQPRSGTVHYDFISDTLDWDTKYELRKKYVHFVPAHALHELIGSHGLYYQQRYYTIEESPSPTTVRGYLGERMNNLAQVNLPDSFQLPHLLDQELTRLSNGQVKKIILLKQLLDSIPKILLLDYPFEGLDAQSRMELSDFLDHLNTVHKVQLIIADNEHPQLPRAITKRVLVHQGEILMGDRLAHPAKILSEGVSCPKEKAAQTSPVVEMQAVTIRYGDKIIIDRLNWKVNKGERWALTGRNGSGKTTLFSLIYADHPMAYSEQVYLFGKRRGSGESIWDIKSRISYLGPEHIHFMDDFTKQLTVQEYLRKVSASQEKQQPLIEQFQVQLLVSKRLHQLSGGQLQLILLLALFLNPKELLLLDEPFQFLDPLQKENVSHYLHNHLEESTTLILITHYEDDVRRWTHDRIRL